MTEAEDMANRCLQGRGYIVIATRSPHPDLPFVLEEVTGGCYGDINSPITLIAQTDLDDLISQAKFLGITHSHDSDLYPYYYRAVAE